MSVSACLCNTHAALFNGSVPVDQQQLLGLAGGYDSSGLVAADGQQQDAGGVIGGLSDPAATAAALAAAAAAASHAGACRQPVAVFCALVS